MPAFVKRWGSTITWAAGVIAALAGLLTYGDTLGRWYLSGHLAGYALAADVGKLDQRQKDIEGKVDTLDGKVDTLTRVILEGRHAEVQGKITTLTEKRNLTPAEAEYLRLLRTQERTLRGQLRKAP